MIEKVRIKKVSPNYFSVILAGIKIPIGSVQL